ncbi:phosphoribosyltransferase [Pararhizobium antarcticum]|uniref:Phosphoribosyltransferase n=1 Tax=Pararhizobium antarcticum TaxID=1798805 RepID=A0A657LYZ3_9HYPH|nr:phosphoribosyltransferase [Pararhizobium antarcticum]OJF97540.1 phosphoribosyltransferase [Rhizobium sp. 58]OJF98788.1 phosphoribosyltransferase [Pararhizobium antarcticum]OJF98825.1 phosphoribosyltransferase [Pararhizobium antarcticum]
MQPHDFWQELHPPATVDPLAEHRDFYPATLGDGRHLRLPIRPLADGHHALASLIINQASFAVQDALSEQLADRLTAFRPDVIVGLPTLGLTLASGVARALGHSRYVPLGTSKKFWYDADLSVPMSSITTPDQVKRLYIDPRMLPLLQGRRVVLVDDVISSGSSIVAGLSLLAIAGIEPVGIGAAMLQSDRWRARLAERGAHWPDRTLGAFSTPLLSKTAKGGWSA